MKSVILISTCLAAIAAFGACSSGGKSAATPTAGAAPVVTSGAPKATPVATAPPSAAGSPIPTTDPGSKLSVTGGPIGGTASATMHTTPGASCTITYIHPSGKTSTLKALVAQTAGPDGVVTWTWNIDPGTKPAGQGTVTVVCGSEQATQPITILAAVPTP